MEKKRDFIIGLAICDKTVIMTQPGKVILSDEVFDLPLGVHTGTREDIKNYMNMLLDKFLDSLEETDAKV